MDRKYLISVIALLILVVGGGIYYVFSKNNHVSDNVSLPLPTFSASIEPTPEIIASDSGNIITMDDGLKIEDIIEGTGEEAIAGKTVTVNYTGTLLDGTKFDSSYDRNQPFVFNLGTGQVIQGWDEGVVGMKVGGKRKLVIPAALGYGENGIPGAIPGGATLVFEVELLKVD